MLQTQMNDWQDSFSGRVTHRKWMNVTRLSTIRTWMNNWIIIIRSIAG